MKGLELWILSYLINSLWQVPLLFASGWLTARVLRSAGSVVEHRVWVTVLVLQSVLPAICLLSWEWLQRLPLWAGHANRSGEAEVSIVMGSGSGFGEFHLSSATLTAIALGYSSIFLYCAARFVWRNAAVSAMRRAAVPAPLSAEAAVFWARCAQQFGIDKVAIAASSRIAGPVALGIQHKLVLLPLGMVGTLPEEDLKTVIAHEFAHMYRQDFLKNLLYEWLALPVAYHPLLWLTRSRIMETREMICDEMAAGLNGQKLYARSLLRLARLLVEGTQAVTPHTIGIFDANTFERRIMNIMEKQKQIRGLRRVAIVAACAVLGIGISGSAVAVAVHLNPAASDNNNNKTKAPQQLSISAAKMAGNIMTKVAPTYPPAAKKAGIQGAVLLSVVIDRDGIIENVKVLSGPQELQQSALDAVRQWKYKPYLLNGDPVEVLTTVNVIYSLKG